MGISTSSISGSHGTIGLTGSVYISGSDGVSELSTSGSYISSSAGSSFASGSETTYAASSSYSTYSASGSYTSGSGGSTTTSGGSVVITGSSPALVISSGELIVTGSVYFVDGGTLNVSGAISCASTISGSGAVSGLTGTFEEGVSVGNATIIDADKNLTNVASITAGGDLTVTGDTHTFQSTNSKDPLVIIKNTTNDANGARLRFIKDKGAAGAADDDIGLIQFYGDDANQDQVEFARIRARVAVETNGQEGGQLDFQVASHDGEMNTGLRLKDGSAEDEIDVTIGAGADSLTTIAGDLDIPNGGFALGSDADGDIYFRNSGNLQRLAKGDDDQVLTLASGVPSWAAAAAGSTFSNLSGSGTLQAVGATTLGSTLNVSGNVLVAGETHLSNSAGTEVLRIAKADGDTREIVFENEGTDKVSMYMNSAEHFFLRQHDAAKDIILRMNTTNVLQLDGDASTAKLAWPLELGVDDTGVDFRIYSATTNEGILYDASEDELALLLTTKLKFHDVGGGEEIYASSNGHLEINSGTTLDITAPTVDINASTAVTIDGPSLAVASSTSQKPLVEIKNTTNDAYGPVLRFVKDKGAAGAANDVAGMIEFYADDAAQDQVLFSRIAGQVSVHTNGQEGGLLALQVASHDGEINNGLVLVDGSAEDEIDVTIGNGADSITTVAGDLAVTGADIVVGSDGDGTDRTITFGHSTLKTIMGIDDSADTFILNTDSAFDGTVADNSLSIDANHKMIVGGSLRAKGYIVPHYVQYNTTANSEKALPMYIVSEAASPGSTDSVHIVVAPFDGILKRALVRTSGAQNGNVDMRIYKVADGTGADGFADSDEVEFVRVSMGNADTTSVFNTSGSSHFSAGEAVSVSLDMNSNPGDVNVSLIWEYNTSAL